MPANRRRSAATAPYDRWELLGRLLDKRRRVLGHTWRTTFERDRGINTRLAAEIEKAAKDRVNHFMPGTLQLVAHGYAVTYESVLALLHGERDDLVPAPAPAAPPDEGTPPMTPEQAAADQPWFDEINERRVALAAQGITNPTGEQMFPGAPGDAQAWDGIGDRWPVGDRVWFIARLRRLAAGRIPPNSGTGATTA
jgi:hypothetical protein